MLSAWAVLSIVPAAAQTAAADDGLSQYERVLEDPNGVASNLSYAQSLQATGQNGEAQQVYQKVLSLDPNNVTARAALPTITSGGAIAALGATPAASGAQTDYTLRFGIGYESNSAHLPPTSAHGYSDAVGFGEFTVNDTRQVGGITLQSNFDIYSNAHARYTLGDLTYATVDTGPLFNLGDNGKLRVAAGTEYVLLGQSSTSTPTDVVREFEFNAGNMILNWFPARAQALQSVNLLVGYDNFRKSLGYQSGVVMHMTAPFVFNDLPAATHTQVIVTPGFIYNGANQPDVVPPLEPAHYAEGDLDLLTLTPLAERTLGADRVLGKLGIFADTQHYDSHAAIPTNDRQDIQLIPVAGVRLAGFLWPRVQLDLDYRYDRNFSNDAAQRFTDHIVSLIATVRF
ncbi:MAG TPA: hypothetical protein VME45_01635 [Stellaceae bacterium]|nr:hypothetical protein [Stellaceae bacterium]